jgi:threonine/homoserine/homoserine lactone efflux protein
MSRAWLLSTVLKIFYHLFPKSQMLFDVLPWCGAAVLPWWVLPFCRIPVSPRRRVSLPASLFH